MDIDKLYETNPKLKKSDVKILEKWMKTQPHLPQTNENMIIILLNACDLNIEKSKKCIEYYYTIRTSFTGMFSERDPESPKLIKGLNSCIFEPLKQLTPNNTLVLFIKFVDPSLEVFDFFTFVKLMDMRIHSWLRKFGCVRGIEILIDMEGWTFKHWQKCGLLNARKVMNYMLEGFPMKLKCIHFAHPPGFLDAILHVLLPLLPFDITHMIKIHSSLDSLVEALPKYCIPNELNGTGGSLEELQKNFIQAIKKDREYFIDDERCKTDESKRIRTGWQRFLF